MLRTAVIVTVLGLVPLAASCGGKGAPAPAAAAPVLGDPFGETVGGLAVGHTDAAVIAILGEPATRSPAEEMGATGELISTWSWPDQGVTLAMAMTGERGEVSSMTFSAPCKFTTSRGVGLGMTRPEVEKIYAEFIGKGRDEGEPDPSSETQLVIGSIYGGTFYEFDGGKVVQIFVGAGAE